MSSIPDNTELLKEYRERNIRWAGESLKQLSFYNNLLLTLSVGFLSFSFQLNDFKGICYTWSNIDWSITLLVASITFIVISILAGLFLVRNRLEDFRLTRQINQIRQRMLEHSEAKLDESPPDKFNFWRRTKLVFENYPIITLEECKKYKKSKRRDKERIKANFRALRNITYNLGLNTLISTELQTICFALSMITYLSSRLLN